MSASAVLDQSLLCCSCKASVVIFTKSKLARCDLLCLFESQAESQQRVRVTLYLIDSTFTVCFEKPTLN